jgi:hypothetical protein
MAPSANLHGGSLCVRRNCRVAGPRPGGLTDRVGQSQQIVMGRWWRHKVGREPDNLPAARGGEPLGVLGAQVVAMRLGVGGQRPEDGSGV